jgi:thiamine biosynthesis protein ThiI
MNEVILCKYGEVILKGANKARFESILQRDLRRRAAKIGKFDVSYGQSTVYIVPLDDDSAARIDDMYAEAKRTFGFVGVARAAVVEKTLEAVLAAAKEYLPPYLAAARTFKVETKRSDKRFPLKSPEISGEVGGAILDAMPSLRVDLENPDVVVRVEIREHAAYIHAGQDKGAGGMPLGSNGRGLLLLSGGIDSPVAAHMMAKRGMTVESVYFESPPYTSELARDKVFELARILTGWCGRMRVNVMTLTHLQEEIRDKCDEDYFTLILRRAMMRLAQRLADERGCAALVTGESLGQVASQTLAAIAVTDCVAASPVFRPLIGLDKQEIIVRAREIGTFDTSILPYEDCCTVFTPRHPRTQPELAKVEAEEAKLDLDALLDEAWEARFHKIIE